MTPADIRQAAAAVIRRAVEARRHGEHEDLRAGYGVARVLIDAAAGVFTAPTAVTGTHRWAGSAPAARRAVPRPQPDKAAHRVVVTADHLGLGGFAWSDGAAV